jgi:hypothetical protein
LSRAPQRHGGDYTRHLAPLTPQGCAKDYKYGPDGMRYRFGENGKTRLSDVTVSWSYCLDPPDSYIRNNRMGNSTAEDEQVGSPPVPGPVASYTIAAEHAKDVVSQRTR